MLLFNNFKIKIKPNSCRLSCIGLSWDMSSKFSWSFQLTEYTCVVLKLKYFTSDERKMYYFQCFYIGKSWPVPLTVTQESKFWWHDILNMITECELAVKYPTEVFKSVGKLYCYTLNCIIEEQGRQLSCLHINLTLW